MKIFRNQPSNYTCNATFQSLDVGFDPRSIGMVCVLDADATRVAYEKNGVNYVCDGDIKEILWELADAGYTIKLSNDDL